MGGDSPVLGVVVLLRIVFLVVCEEGIELKALFEVFNSFKAADVFQVVEVPVCVYTSANQSVPVNALQFHIGVVILEVEVHLFSKVNIRTFDRVHVLTSHLELVEVEVFREDLHLNYLL